MSPRTLASWEKSGAYPCVSFVVVNYRNAPATIACLESIRQQRYNGGIHTVLVENGSGDESASTLRDYLAGRNDVDFVANPTNLGFTGGVLSGIGKVQGELVCLLNNDSLLSSDTTQRLVDRLRGRADLGAVWPLDREPGKGHAEPMPKGNGTTNVLGGIYWVPVLRDMTECFSGSGVCLLFPKGILDPIFPEEYFAYYEDVFFGWHLRLMGLGTERVPEAVLIHEGSSTSRREPKLRSCLTVHAEKNRLCNLLILYETRTLLRLMPLLFLDEAKKVLLTIVYLLTGRNGFRYAALNLQSRIWILRHAGWVWRWRRQVQSERKVSDEKVMELMSASLYFNSGRLGEVVNALSRRWCFWMGLNTVEGRIRG